MYIFKKTDINKVEYPPTGDIALLFDTNGTLMYLTELGQSGPIVPQVNLNTLNINSLSMGTLQALTTPGQYSLTMGSNNIDSGLASIAQGENAYATGQFSFARGQFVSAAGDVSTCFGQGINAANLLQANATNAFVVEWSTQSSPAPATFYGIDAFSDFSAILGGTNSTIDNNSNSSAIIGGTHNYITNASNAVIIGGNRNEITSSSNGSVILGGNTISAIVANAVFVPSLVLTNNTTNNQDLTTTDGMLFYDGTVIHACIDGNVNIPDTLATSLGNNTFHGTNTFAGAVNMTGIANAPSGSTVLYINNGSVTIGPSYGDTNVNNVINSRIGIYDDDLVKVAHNAPGGGLYGSNAFILWDGDGLITSDITFDYLNLQKSSIVVTNQDGTIITTGAQIGNLANNVPQITQFGSLTAGSVVLTDTAGSSNLITPDILSGGAVSANNLPMSFISYGGQTFTPGPTNTNRTFFIPVNFVYYSDGTYLKDNPNITYIIKNVSGIYFNFVVTATVLATTGHDDLQVGSYGTPAGYSQNVTNFAVSGWGTNTNANTYYTHGSENLNLYINFGYSNGNGYLYISDGSDHGTEPSALTISGIMFGTYYDVSGQSGLTPNTITYYNGSIIR